MRRAHFEAFAPVCPVCAARGGQERLRVSTMCQSAGDTVIHGILVCPSRACQHEYPILDGIPVITADLGTLLGERGIELMVRQDLPAPLESLLGDAIGADSWYDALRQTLSTYGWDSYAGLDPDEMPGRPSPGAAAALMLRLLDMCAPAAMPAAGYRAIDLGCGAGGSTFALAARLPGALVLGVDRHLGLLRLAAGAGQGRVRYPRRRIGLVYDTRAFPVCLEGADRVDFWAADALALPLTPGSADIASALNLLDSVADPAGLLVAMTRLIAPGGCMMLATPFDWSTRATRPAAWIGGHSQRAAHGGAAEPFLHHLLDVPGLSVIGRQADAAWHTRLHERSFVAYRAYLVAICKDREAAAEPGPGPRAGA